MRISTYFLAGLFVSGLAACDTAKQATEATSSATSTSTTSTVSAAAIEKNGIRLTPFLDSPKYPTAQPVSYTHLTLPTIYSV